jgi:uncharacterized membrane protein
MDRSTLLARISLLKGLGDADRRALSEHLVERTYARGDQIFALGDRGASMYLVAQGAVHIYLPPAQKGDSVIGLKVLRTGEHFGELALFDDKPRSASAEALEQTTLWELSRQDFIQGLIKSPTSVLAVLSELGNRLRDTNALLSQRAARDAVRELEDNLSWAERLADKVAAINGSWQFIIVLCAVSLLWAALNFVLPHPFDAYPYVFFNLVLALLVAFQGPLIVMSQNRQAEKERLQAATDFQVNLKNEVMIETLVREMADFRREVSERMAHLEGPAERPPSVKASA